MQTPTDDQARKSLTAFKRLIYRRYQHSNHLKLLDQKLSAVTRYIESGGKRGIGFLIVEMPPRSGKTLSISRLFPIWHLGRNPDHRIILASYGATLAHKNSRAARNIVGSRVYKRIFRIELAPDSRSVEAWDIKGHEGGMVAVGVGGSITGFGANLILCDDPVKSREEAESETYREKLWDWFTDDLYTRREPGAAVVVVMNRWNVDDLVGRLLRKQPEKWHEVRLPAIAEEGDLLRRKEGAPLWPKRFPLAALRDIEATLGPYAWAGLYQQCPTPSEGGLFKRAYFHVVAQAPEIKAAWRFWDLAMSARGDFSVGVKMGLGEDGHYFVLDVARSRLDWAEVPDFLASVMMADGPSVIQGIEQQGYMSRAIQEMNADPRLHGYTIWGCTVDQAKYVRALPVAAKMAAGLIHIVRAHWNDDFLDELTSFPGGQKDDQVDSFSGVYTMASEQSSNAGGEIHYAQDNTSSGAY